MLASAHGPTMNHYMAQVSWFMDILSTCLSLSHIAHTHTHTRRHNMLFVTKIQHGPSRYIVISSWWAEGVSIDLCGISCIYTHDRSV